MARCMAEPRHVPSLDQRPGGKQGSEQPSNQPVGPCDAIRLHSERQTTGSRVYVNVLEGLQDR